MIVERKYTVTRSKIAKAGAGYMLLGLMLAFFYGREVRNDIAFIKQELRGIEYIQATAAFWESIFLLHESPNLDARDRDGKIATAESAFTVLQGASETLGKHLLLNNLAVPGQAAMNGSIPVLRDRLTLLEHDVVEGKVGKSDDENHGAMVDGLFDLLQHVYNASNLILDPEIDSYYMALLASRNMPQEIKRMFYGKIKLWNLYKNSGATFMMFSNTFRVKEAVHDLSASQAYDDIDGVFAKIGKYGRNFAMIPADDVMLLRDSLAQYQAARAGFLTTVEKSGAVPDADVFPLLEEAFFNLQRQTFSTWRVQQDVMSTLLQERMQDRENIFYAVMAMCGIGYTLIGIFNLLTIRRMTDQVGILYARVRKFSRGVIGDVVPFQGQQDELGQLAGAVEAFRRLVEDLHKRSGDTYLYQRLEAIMANVADSIIFIDKRGTIDSVNRGFVRMFGYTEDEVAGKNVSMLMPEPYRGAHDGYLYNYLNTGEAKIIGIGREVTGRRKDGTSFAMSLNVSRIDVGDAIYFLGIVRDLTAGNSPGEKSKLPESKA